MLFHLALRASEQCGYASSYTSYADAQVDEEKGVCGTSILIILFQKWRFLSKSWLHFSVLCQNVCLKGSSMIVCVFKLSSIYIHAEDLLWLRYIIFHCINLLFFTTSVFVASLIKIRESYHFVLNTMFVRWVFCINDQIDKSIFECRSMIWIVPQPSKF